MKQIPSLSYRKFCLLLTIVALPSPAEVTLDGSLGGASGELQGPNYAIQADMGVQRGGNLFHSFGDFNLNSAESATFNDVGVITPVENILSRVTGGRPSIIDGQISTDFENSQPNLFFMNPAGVVFGPNASLDVQGSFHVTTANYLKLEGQGVFHADLNEKTHLNITQVAAFGFLDAEVGEITINESQLAIPNGESLSLIGGNINYTGDGLDENNLFNSFLFAPSGRINLASVNSVGEVRLTPDSLDTTSFNQLGDITLSNGALLNSNGEGAGHIVIHGAELTQDASGIFSINFGDSIGTEQGINIALRESLLVNNGSRILSNTSASGNAGDITITSDMVQIIDGGQISASTFGSGKGGVINITADDQLTLSGINSFSEISSITTGTGNAGNISIVTPVLTMNGSTNILTTTGGDGHAGDVTIDINNLTMFGESFIGANSGIFDGEKRFIGKGNAGEVIINAREFIVLSGNNGFIPTIASLKGTGGTGKGGRIEINAHELHVNNGARIRTNTSGENKAGNVEIKVSKLTLTKGALIRSSSGVVVGNQVLSGKGSGGNIDIVADNIEITDNSRIAVESFSEDGDAGDITITSDTVQIIDGGEISASTFGSGKGGVINITADDQITLSGINAFSEISSITTGTGNAGTISLVTPILTMNGSTNILTTTGGDGHAGNVTIDIDNLTMFGESFIGANSGIFDGEKRFIGKGNAGEVIINAREFIVLSGNNGFIPTIASLKGTGGTGKGGRIEINAHELHVNNGARIRTNTSGENKAGDVEIKVSKLTLTKGALIRSSSGVVVGNQVLSGKGSGGNIDIVADNIEITDNSRIAAESFSQEAGADAGSIKVTANEILQLSNGGQITVATTQANAGNIELNIGHLLQLNDDSAITTSAAVVNNQGTGNGGNIGIKSNGTKPAFTILDDNSRIIAQARQGDGGNINFDANTIIFRAPATVIDASSDSGEQGTVTIDSPDTNLIDGALMLPGAFLDASALLSEHCANRSGKPASSFIIRPFENIQPTPEDYLSGFYPDRATGSQETMGDKNRLPVDVAVNNTRDARFSGGCSDE